MEEDSLSDDEFHETFEDINSTTSSDSGDDLEMRTSSMRVAPLAESNLQPHSTPSAFQSKFSIWKDDPSSIHERRQRFFMQMGLKSYRDDISHADVPDISGRFVTNGEKVVKKFRNVGEKVLSGARTEEFVKTDSEKRGDERKRMVSEDRVEVSQLGVDWAANISLKGAFGVVVGEGHTESSSRSSGSGLAGQIPCDCADSVSYGIHSFRARFVNRSNRGSMRKSSDSGRSLSLDVGSQLDLGYHHRASISHDELLQFFDPDCGYQNVSSDGYYAVENVMEERLKIRDLDSGREFLMKRFNSDGSLDLLREVDTGKELTLAEFEKTIGTYSPVAQVLKRREQLTDSHVSVKKPVFKTASKASVILKRTNWLRKLKGFVKSRSVDGLVGGGSERSFADSVDDSDTSLELESISEDITPRVSRGSPLVGMDRNESTTRGLTLMNDISDSFWRRPQKVKVKLRHKSSKDLGNLHLSQEILAHQGAIWTMKFSPDGRYLASAGQDRVVHVWEVIDHPLVAESDLWSSGQKVEKRLGRRDGSVKANNDGSVKAGRCKSFTKWDIKGNSRSGNGTPQKQRSSNYSETQTPNLLWLSEKPTCSFRGHTDDILDLSWSQSQFLLSSSMDKTVRLWHISYDVCLRVFSHNDYVTCAQFNPVDDRYFISGSLDDKVRIWCIPDHHVVDWSDLQEMVTAVCYAPDGKWCVGFRGRLLVPTKGPVASTIPQNRCVAGNKLQLDAHKDVRDENKKGAGKKITGIRCMPGDPHKVLVTSNDSCVRIYDGLDLVAKYKGLRNVKSQISSSFSSTGDFIISASEDSRVLVWNSNKKDISNRSSVYRRDKQLACEEFTSRYVSVAISWPGSSTHHNSSLSVLEPPGKSDRFGTAQVTSEPGSSPRREENVVIGTKGLGEQSKGPSYCLRSPMRIFYGRKSSVAVADEFASTKQVGSDYEKKHDNQRNTSQVDVSSKVFGPSPPLDARQSSPSHMQQRCTSFFLESGPKGSATWPEEKLSTFNKQVSSTPTMTQSASIGSSMTAHSGREVHPLADLATVSAAWGLVIVTAGLGGNITTFQNYGFPVRL
nr:uncharacterized protein LOC112280292 isoform X1 [Physcomitrium patens]|eukprot:XP_024371387.1 uncharacterized protein LOC112280292 isoform X1 [Physcomitrella patens]